MTTELIYGKKALQTKYFDYFLKFRTNENRANGQPGLSD